MKYFYIIFSTIQLCLSAVSNASPSQKILQHVIENFKGYELKYASVDNAYFMIFHHPIENQVLLFVSPVPNEGPVTLKKNGLNINWEENSSPIKVDLRNNGRPDLVGLKFPLGKEDNFEILFSFVASKHRQGRRYRIIVEWTGDFKMESKILQGKKETPFEKVILQ